MNKRERVTAAFRGLETDHTPVCMWKHVPPEFWADDDRFAQEQARFLHSTDVDFMKLSGDKFFGWPAPVLKDIENPANLLWIKPLGPDHPFIRGQIERTKKVVKALDGECPAIYLIFSPLSYIRLQIGYPKMMRFIRENPEAMKYACQVVAEDVKLEEYLDWVKPADKTVLDYANSLSDMNAIHFCAWEEVPNRLSVWKDYKAPVVSWSRYMDIMDIGEAKKHFGCTVWGGFDNRPGTFLYTADRAEIEKETESLIAQGGKSGYIVGSDCSIHDELPEERIRWVVDRAHAV